MEYQEYPKALYKGDTSNCVIVVDQDDEAAQRDAGYVDAAEITASGATSTGATYDTVTDMDVLLAEAAELGIKVDSRWRANRLATEIAAAKKDA